MPSISRSFARALDREVGLFKGHVDPTNVAKLIDIKQNGVSSVKGFDAGGRANTIFKGCHEQGIYNPHIMRDFLQFRYPNATITSSTLPAQGMRGTAVKPLDIYRETGVTYDPRRLPNFTDRMIYDMQIPVVKFFPQKGSGQTLDQLRSNHMRQATQQLRADIKAGNVSRNQFDLDQLKAIQSGEPKIPGFTWEHNPRAGRMLLVPEGKHKYTPHVGSIRLFQ